MKNKKPQMCIYKQHNTKCFYGEKCWHAHSQEELDEINAFFNSLEEAKKNNVEESKDRERSNGL
jgi:hypothetical protein